MKKYTLQDLILGSQYFYTKPDPYIIQKGINKAMKRLQSKNILLISMSIVVGMIVGVGIFFARRKYFAL